MRKLNSTLSLGKLSRLLDKSYKKRLPYYDPYERRMYLGILTYHREDGEIIKFDVRGFKWDSKRYKLLVNGVNWTHYAGVCYIKLDASNVKQFKFTSKY